MQTMVTFTKYHTRVDGLDYCTFTKYHARVGGADNCTVIELIVQTMVQFTKYHARVDGADYGTVHLISCYSRWCRLWYCSLS